ncbi:MAG: thioredoxin family protein [Bacteroidetes bacterium]|nr:thioredoxin family protein [Bacteroidota bacterium]
MNFSLTNIDDQQISLDNFPHAKGFIIIFTCNHCPYAIAYEERIQAIQEKYAPLGFPVIAINSNDPHKYPQDSFENMKIRAASKGFNFPYLFDETQEIARMYRATRTPHVFLLQKANGGFNLVYQGAIDDNYKNPQAVTETYLTDQVDALIANGEVPYRETPPIGCTIKWK